MKIFSGIQGLYNQYQPIEKLTKLIKPHLNKRVLGIALVALGTIATIFKYYYFGIPAIVVGLALIAADSGLISKIPFISKLFSRFFSTSKPPQENPNNPPQPPTPPRPETPPPPQKKPTGADTPPPPPLTPPPSPPHDSPNDSSIQKSPNRSYTPPPSPPRPQSSDTHEPAASSNPAPEEAQQPSTSAEEPTAKTKRREHRREGAPHRVKHRAAEESALSEKPLLKKKKHRTLESEETGSVKRHSHKNHHLHHDAPKRAAISSDQFTPPVLGDGATVLEGASATAHPAAESSSSSSTVQNPKLKKRAVSLKPIQDIAHAAKKLISRKPAEEEHPWELPTTSGEEHPKAHVEIKEHELVGADQT